MKFYTDHYFHIGYQHYISGKPCQDYAISKQDNDISCAIISDGCSTGGNTDIGARLISLITLDYLNNNKLAIDKNIAEYVNSKQLYELKYQKILLDLDYSDLLATCCYVYVFNNNMVVNISGDGVVVIKFRNNRSLFYKLSWSNNIPIYPIYYLDEAGYIIPHDSKLIVDSNIYATYYLEQANIKYGSFFIVNNFYDIEYVAIFTDGICQVDNVDWKEAVRDFTNFKNTKGEFLKRRMIKQIKEYQKIGKGPLDDIAGAIIRIEE